MNNLVNYDIQQAQQAQETTITPGTGGAFIDVFNNIEDTANKIGSLGRYLGKRGGSGGGSWTEDPERIAVYEQEVAQLAIANENKPMTGPEIIERKSQISAEYPDLKPATKKAVDDKYGLDINTSPFTQYARDINKKTQEEKQEEDAYYYDLFQQNGSLDGRNLSYEEQVKKGKEIEKTTLILFSDLETASDSETPNEVREMSLENAGKILENQARARATRYVQITGQVPNAAQLTEMEQATTNDFISRGIDPVVARRAAQFGFKSLRNLANDKTKSEEDIKQALINANKINSELAEKRIYDRTGYTTEQFYRFGSYFPHLNKDIQDGLIKAVNTALSNRENPNSKQINSLVLADQEAFDSARQISSHIDETTPQTAAAATVMAVDTTTSKAQKDLDLKDRDTLLTNLNIVANTVTTLMQKYPQMSEADQKMTLSRVEDLVKTSLEQTIFALESDGISYEIKNGKLLPAGSRGSFEGNSRMVSFNGTLSKLQNALPSIPKETWNGWLEQVSAKKNTLSASAEAQQKDIQTYNKYAEEQGLEKAESLRFSDEEMEDMLNENNVNLLKKLKPVFMDSLKAAYIELPNLSPEAGSPRTVEIEEALISKGIATREEIDSMKARIKTGQAARSSFRSNAQKPFNNPLNIKDTKQDWKGQTGSRNNFVTFEKPEDGIRAASKLANTYSIMHGIETVKDFITRYAPPEENDTESYISYVCAALGVSPDEKVDFTDTEVKAKMIKAMIDIESPGRYKYTEEDIKKIIAK